MSDPYGLEDVVRRTSGRSVAVVLGVAVLAAVAGLPVSASASAARPAPAPAVGPMGGEVSSPADGGSPGDGQGIEFGACADEALVAARAECAMVAVPLDHRDPDGRTIDVAVSRLPARDPGRRRGVLLVNPGGPGTPGLAYSVHLREVLGEAADQYDLIGFDPRFTGLSTPITCGPTTFSATFRSAGEDRAGFRESGELAADFARACHDRHADVLPFAGTADVARDLDVVRAALGEERISYYGVSWGTRLGAAYSQLFPDRVDRMVLDSALEGTTHQQLQEQGPVAEAALDEWAAWTAARDDRYHLGTTPAAVRSAVERLITGLARRPVTVEMDGQDGQDGQDHVLDDNTFPLLLQRWLNHEDDDASLAATVRDLVEAAATGVPVTASPELAGRLGFFDAHDPMLDTGLAAAWANFCADSPWPSRPGQYWRQIQRSRRSLPVFGPLAHNVRPCTYWSASPPEPPLTIGNAVPMLIVQAERDNNTPLAGARRLHERLTGSRLVTADVRAHGVYGRAADGYTPVPCIDDLVNQYLSTGTLPAHDRSCG